MYSIDYWIVFIYLFLILVMGLLAGRGIKSLEGFAVAGRNYTTLIIFATLSASFIGGGFTMGNAEKVFILGIVNIFALWGFSLKEILVASFIAPRMDRFSGVISVGDIMGRSYGKPGQIVAGFFGVLLCSGIVGAQVGAMGYVFNVMVGLDFVWGILIGCGIVIAYSTVGGMRAVVITDILQFVVLGIGIPLTLFFGIEAAGGWEAVKTAVPLERFSPFGGMTLPTFASLFLTFLLGETLVPPYVQRLLIGKNASHTSKGTLLSGIFSFPFFVITGSIGLVALALKPDLDPNLALPFVVQQTLPWGLKGLVVAGIISVVMSSADSFLNSAAVAFCNDLINPLRRVPLTARAQLWLAKLINLMVGVLAVIFALKIKSILDILIYAYNFWSPVILPPLLAALFGVRTRPLVFICGSLAGFCGVWLWKYGLHAPGGIDGLVVGVLCNTAVFLLGWRISAKAEKK